MISRDRRASGDTLRRVNWRSALQSPFLALLCAPFGCQPAPAAQNLSAVSPAVVAPVVHPGVAPASAVKDALEPSPIRFRDVSETCGIQFVHRSGSSPEKEFPTCLGSGVAMLDYDGDGWLDLYFATARSLPLAATDSSPGNRLYRNRRDGTFEDVTEQGGRWVSRLQPRRRGGRR